MDKLDKKKNKPTRCFVRRPRRASSRVYLYSMRRPSPDYIKAGAAAVSCSRSELPFNSRPQRAKIRASFRVLSYARHLSFCVDNFSDVMRGFLLILLTALFALAVAAEKYPEKYDNVDVDRILQNNRVLTNYIRCLMDEGPCTAEGRELRKTLPDALSTGCSKCNDKQKTTAEKVINHLKMKRSKDWDRLISKYDSNGEYRKRFERS